MNHSGGDGLEEARRWLDVAVRLLGANDFVGSKRFAERALEADPLLDGVDQILAVADVLLAAQHRVNNQINWYAVLQITPPTSDPSSAVDNAAVKRQYRHLALLLRPDRNKPPGADAALRLVVDAYAVLSDPDKKSLFDAELRIATSAASAVKPSPFSSAAKVSPFPPGFAAGGDPFWTACTSCCHVHQYPREYAERSLRCPTCRRAFVATDTLVGKAIEKKKRKSRSSPPLPPAPPAEVDQTCSSSPPMAFPHHNNKAAPFLFPKAESSVLPDPSGFFSGDLLHSPLPTNSFFQNFVLNNGDVPEYIHPYLIKAASSSLTFCYPSRYPTSPYIYQTFTPDLTISAAASGYAGGAKHVISSFDDLSLTLDIPPALRFFLVRGSPFITCATIGHSAAFQLSISSVNAFISVSSNTSYTKHILKMNSGQTFLCYSSAPLRLTQESNSLLTTEQGYSGVVRVALLPDPSYESVLDQFSTCYAISGRASFSRQHSIEYKWEKRGWGGLLLLAHPLHLKLFPNEDDNCITVLNDFKYKSIDGDLVGVIGDSWILKTDTIPITWHSKRGLDDDSSSEIISALSKDVDELSSSPITTTSSYFYGKAIARAARLALIAEEVCFPDVIPSVQQFLKNTITPWLDGSFNGNGFLYDPKWGGLVTKQGSTDSGADFGFGIFNDHHYHLGYFLYAIAVLAKLDPTWGRMYRPQAYSMMADFMTLTRRSGGNYTRLRCFDLWKLHSWAGGLTEFADGRNQESSSEAVNAYYSAALMGLSYGDTNLLTIGSTLTAFEIQAARTWWHVKEAEGMYEPDFTAENRLVGVLWNNKRDSGLWFAPAEWKECRLGIQVLPLLPITEVLFKDVEFVKQLVKWTLPALAREGVGEGWKGFVYAMEGIYDKDSALQKTRELTGFDDGNSISNLLWWLYSRADEELVDHGCWFAHYCN